MTKDKKPTYEQLAQRLAEAEQYLEAIRRGEVDVVIGEAEPLVLRSLEMERRLEESEAALVEAQDIAKIGSWQYDVAQDKPTWSREMFRIFDRDPDRGEPKWEDHREHIHPDDWDRLNRAKGDASENMRPYRETFRIVRRDGVLTWAESIGRVQTDSGGEVVRLMGTVQDITKRKMAEEALRESQLWLETVFNSQEDALFVAAPDRKIVSFNPAAIAMFGYPQHELLAQSTAMLHVDREHYEEFGQRLKSAFDRSQTAHFEFEARRKNGEVFPTEHTVSLLKNDDGGPMGILSVVRDITERKLTERALADNEKKYRLLYSSIRDAILVADTNRKIIDCNPTFSALFGYSLEEIIGRETSTIYANMDEFSRMGREIKAHAGDNSFHMLVNFQKKSGDIFPGETSVHYIQGDDDELTGFIGIIRDVSHKVADEQALIQSENRFRTAFEDAPEGMALIDAERHFIRVNKSLCEILGYSEDELLGKSFNQFTHPDDRQSGRERWHQILKKNINTNRTEKRYVHKNGNIVWVQISNTAIHDEQGKFKYVLSHIYDITARVNYQQDLIRERDLSQKYLDTAGVILLALDKQGRIEMINRKGCELIGCFTEDLLGQNWIDNFIPEDLRPKIKTIHRKIIAGLTKPHTHEEAPILTTNGEQRQIRWFNTAITDSNGEIIGTLSSGEDITKQKAAQVAISQLAAIVESSQDAITGKDLQGIITSWNEAAERIYGYSAEEAIGKHISLIVPEDKRGEIEQVLAAVGRGEAIRIHETARRRKDGSLVEVSLSVSPVRDDQKKVVGAATIAHDITEIKKARHEREKLEAQLRQAQKMEAIGTLAGGIAHDFNNILAAIMGYSELARDSLPAESEAAKNIKTVIASAQRAKELTYQILSFSRRTEHKLVVLDMEPIIKEILKMLRATMPSTIDIKQKIPTGTGKIKADPVQIHQILMNLCTNAAQAMGELGGVLSVELDVVDIDELTANGYVGLAPGRYQRLSVGDTGKGMEKEVLERIFEPFFTTKEVGKGTGMGLSVVHGIVKNSGGAITVYSEPGQGTTFHVYLPLVDTKAVGKQPASMRELPKGSESILFVDDEPPLVDIAQKALSRLGYKVQGFTSAQEALTAFKSAPEDFDLLITDYTMPKMTGVQLAREVLTEKPDMPIIICTGFSERLHTIAAEEIGAARLAMKPLMPRELAWIVREVLDKY
ncbi:MAG: PAS domain S-box protein [Desulfarculaceae bacterium]|nr:PAS domain S-box protein [Desulfarculaceae bacterium]MCF8048474.1 PAS domain S-box protein [Desulfarculaceae bacterium]MCF8098291.1 PAS domain S-box protein [Desulfarculaceae bacterium]